MKKKQQAQLVWEEPKLICFRGGAMENVVWGCEEGCGNGVYPHGYGGACWNGTGECFAEGGLNPPGGGSGIRG